MKYAPAMKGYRRLVVWQRAHEAASSVYRLLKTKRLEPWLSSQIMRAAFSVPSNIVEGNARRSPRDYVRFLDTAFASLSELDYQLFFLSDNEIIAPEEYAELLPGLDEIGNRLIALMRAVAKSAKAGTWQQIAEEPGRYSAGADWIDLPPSTFHLPGEVG
ncbi:MAG TPA: four helix bundle protein [Dehalococcoidia bacterium]|nr:four helix bundle protein [Dehalococcoidia bacterium]